MKLVTYNIQYGVGVDGAFDLARIADTVAEADIIALQEVESNWERSGNHDIPAELTRLLPDRYVAWGPAIDLVKLIDGRPAGPAAARRQQGNMILSRFPILSVRNHLLPKYGALDVLDFQRSALEATVACPAGHLRVYSLFLCHLSEQQRVLQIRYLKDIIARSTVEGAPLSGSHRRDASWSVEASPSWTGCHTVLMGDFNLTPDGAAYNELAGDFSERNGRLRRRSDFVDCWTIAQRRVGLESPAAEPDGATRYPSFPPQVGQGRRLDYVFVESALAERVTEARVLPWTKGSDHAPLFVELS